MKAVLVACLISLAAPVSAQQKIVTDSPVVQSLVAMVTGEVPTSLLVPGADPHHFSLKPSQVRELSRADRLIWIGPDFTLWLEGAVAGVTDGLEQVQLGNDDPHGWLDPVTAADWVNKIAVALGEHPETTGFETLQSDLSATLAPLAGMQLLTGHDAYSAFAARFGLTIAGNIADSHAATPGPAHLATLRAKVQSGDIGCIISDSHEIEGYVDLIADGSAVPVVDLDLSGQGIEPGAGFYPALMRDVAAQLQGCL